MRKRRTLHPIKLQKIGAKNAQPQEKQNEQMQLPQKRETKREEKKEIENNSLKAPKSSKKVPRVSKRKAVTPVKREREKDEDLQKELPQIVRDWLQGWIASEENDLQQVTCKGLRNRAEKELNVRIDKHLFKNYVSELLAVRESSVKEQSSPHEPASVAIEEVPVPRMRKSAPKVTVTKLCILLGGQRNHRLVLDTQKLWSASDYAPRTASTFAAVESVLWSHYGNTEPRVRGKERMYRDTKLDKIVPARNGAQLKRYKETWTLWQRNGLPRTAAMVDLSKLRQASTKNTVFSALPAHVLLALESL